MTEHDEQPVRGAGSLLEAEVREVLRRRAEALARSEEQETPGETRRFLLFRVGDDGYALPVEAVREIVTGYQVARIPCTPPHVLGVTSVRGEIVSVTDARVLLDAAEAAGRPASVRPAVLVEAGTVSSALVVDEVLDVVDVPLACVEPPVVGRMREAEGGEATALVSGSIEVDGRIVSILDCVGALAPIDEAT